MDLKLARFLSKKTQLNIAVEVGMSAATYSLIERGYRRPRKAEKERIASVLGVSAEEIEWGAVVSQSNAPQQNEAG